MRRRTLLTLALLLLAVAGHSPAAYASVVFDDPCGTVDGTHVTVAPADHDLCRLTFDTLAVESATTLQITAEFAGDIPDEVSAVYLVSWRTGSCWPAVAFGGHRSTTFLQRPRGPEPLR